MHNVPCINPGVYTTSQYTLNIYITILNLYLLLLSIFYNIYNCAVRTSINNAGVNPKEQHTRGNLRII